MQSAKFDRTEFLQNVRGLYYLVVRIAFTFYEVEMLKKEKKTQTFW